MINTSVLRSVSALAVLIGVLSGYVLAQERKEAKTLSPDILNYVKRYEALLADSPEIRVNPGKEQDAIAYYERIKTVLKFNFLGSSLDSFLEHMGYARNLSFIWGGLPAFDFERLNSFVLMPQNNTEFEALASSVLSVGLVDLHLTLKDFQDDRVLVSRFFAPKIATYYNAAKPFEPINRDDIVPGWRKLIRLKPRVGSKADTDGVISHIYLLFNFKKADPNVDPFVQNESGNNQMIIIPKDQTVGDTAFFVVYQKKIFGYELGLFLQADFDLPGHVAVPVPGAQDSKYYVPRACAECHGHTGGFPVHPQTGQPTDDFSIGVFRFAKPNYLDTDQWYDWMDFDYRGVAGSLNDVVFDGGKDHSASAYARAFGVIRKLNEGIRDDTRAAEPVAGIETFQTLAVKKWLELHANSSARKPYSVRGIGVEKWNASNMNEMRLLRALNNHCFRCHSSLRYNVFDKEAVRNRKGLILYYLNREVLDAAGNRLPGYFMPQGRVLPDAERKEIMDLVTKVFPQVN